MVRSQDSSEASDTFGGGQTPWPGLKTEVDVCFSSSRHRRSRCQVNLSQLVDAQVVPSRDPRLSGNLCSNSIYLRTYSTDSICDSSDDTASFNSEDWYSADVKEKDELATEAKMVKIKVHVNPKYIAETCNIEPSDCDVNQQKVVCSKETCSGRTKTTTDNRNDTAKQMSKQNTAIANGHRECNSETKPTEAAKTAAEHNVRKNQRQHSTTGFKQKQGMTTDGKKDLGPAVEHKDKQKQGMTTDGKKDLGPAVEHKDKQKQGITTDGKKVLGPAVEHKDKQKQGMTTDGKKDLGPAVEHKDKQKQGMTTDGKKDLGPAVEHKDKQKQGMTTDGKKDLGPAVEHKDKQKQGMTTDGKKDLGPAVEHKDKQKQGMTTGGKKVLGPAVEHKDKQKQGMTTDGKKDLGPAVEHKDKQKQGMTTDGKKDLGPAVEHKDKQKQGMTTDGKKDLGPAVEHKDKQKQGMTTDGKKDLGPAVEHKDKQKQGMTTDGKKDLGPAVEHKDEQKKQIRKSNVKMTKHKQQVETSSKKIQKKKQPEYKLDSTGSDVGPKSATSCSQCPTINTENKSEHVNKLPTHTITHNKNVHQDHSMKQCIDKDKKVVSNVGNSSKSVLTRRKKAPVPKEISTRVQHVVDTSIKPPKQDSHKVCVKPCFDKRLASDDVCRVNTEQQEALPTGENPDVGNRPSSPECVRSVKTSCEARTQHERVKGKQLNIAVIMPTTGDTNATRNKTTKHVSVMSEDNISIVVERKSGCRVIQRRKGEASVPDDKSNRPVNVVSRERSSDLSPTAVNPREISSVDQKIDKDNIIVRRCSRWHSTVEHMSRLSVFVEDCLYKQRNYAQQRWTNDIMAFQLHEVHENMEHVYKGRDVHSDRVLTPIKHLPVLSLPTELEASYIESPFVRTLHLQALREWMAKKPLDMLLLGKGQPLGEPLWTLPATSQTNNTVTGSSVEFFDDIFHLLRGGRCGSDDVQDLYPEPCNITQETVHHVFRQVRHYMEFLAKKQASSDGQASSHEPNCRNVNEIRRRGRDVDEERTDICGVGEGPDDIWKILEESEFDNSRQQKRGKILRLKSVDDNVSGILDEFYGNVDELLDTNCLSDLCQKRTKRMLIASHLPKSPHVTKHLMKMLIAMNHDKPSASPDRTNEKRLNGVWEKDTPKAGAVAVLYSPTQPTDFDDCGQLQPDIEIKSKTAKRKTRVVTDDSKCKKRKTKLTSGEDTHSPVDRRSNTGNKRRYNDALSAEIIQLNVEETTVGEKTQKQNAVDKSRSNLDDVVEQRKPAEESRKESADGATECRLALVKDETHNSQMRRFRRQLQSRRTCFLDSYLSSSGDALGHMPVSNFDNMFDQTCSPRESNCNPYVLTGPMLQYFLEPHETQLTSQVSKFCPSPTQFSSEKLEPENSFMWSLALNNVKPKVESLEKSSIVSTDLLTDNRHNAIVKETDVHEQALEDDDTHEPEVKDDGRHQHSVDVQDNHELTMEEHNSHEPTMEDSDCHESTVQNYELAVKGQTHTENVTDFRATLMAYHEVSPTKKLAPVKQGNRLMQAFRQAVEAKKRAKTNIKAAARVLTKHDPEKRPPPKAAVRLFKPPIAFTLMEKTRIATLRAEALTTTSEPTVTTPENGKSNFIVTLPEVSQVNNVAQQSFSSISLQLEDELAVDSDLANGSVRHKPDILQHGLTVRHLSSLSATTKRIYRSNRCRLSRFSSPVTEATVSEPISGQKSKDGNMLSAVHTAHVSSQQYTSCSLQTPTPSPVSATSCVSTVVKKKLKGDTPKKDSTVALSFDVTEDNDRSSDVSESTDEEAVNKKSMYPRELIGFDEDRTSRAALLRLQKLGRTCGTGSSNDNPTPAGKATYDRPGQIQHKCEKRTDPVTGPFVVNSNAVAMLRSLDALQSVMVDVSEPQGSQPVTIICTTDEQSTKANGSPQKCSDCGVGEHGDTGDKLTPTRNKLLQAFRQVVAAKNKSSPNASVKAKAKEQITRQTSNKVTGEPAKKKVIFEGTPMPSHMDESVVQGVTEVKQEELSRQPPKDVLSGGEVGDGCGNAGRMKEMMDVSEPDDGGSDDSHALTECVANAVVVSQWPPLPPEADSLDPFTSCVASGHITNQFPSATNDDVGAIPLPSTVLGAHGLPSVSSVAPSLPSVLTVACTVSAVSSLSSTHPGILSTASSLVAGLSTAPSSSKGPSTAPSLPLDSLVFPSYPMDTAATLMQPKPPIPTTGLITLPPSFSTAPPVPPDTSDVPTLPTDPMLLPPLPTDTTNQIPPPLPPDPATPPPPDPSTAPPLPPLPDTTVEPPPPVDTSTGDVPTKMPWMTDEPSALDQQHLQAMSAFLRQRAAAAGTDSLQEGTDTSMYTDVPFPPQYDVSTTDPSAYWCQYYSHVNPYMWGWEQWGGYWSNWQQQLQAGYSSEWSTSPYRQPWTHHPPPYTEQTTGRARRFLLPTPDSSQPPPCWDMSYNHPPVALPPSTLALSSGEPEKTQSTDPRTPVLVNKTRMYVLNRDRSVCKSIERFLLFMGAKSLDPFNLSLLPPLPDEVYILIHKADACQLHQIPNLLKLKEEERIQFVVYQDVMDVKHRLYTPILSRGGMLVADDMALFGVNPDTLLHLVEYMKKQSDGGTPWCLKVHQHMLKYIERARLKYHTASRAYNRLGEVIRILTTHESVVEILPDHATCTRPHPSPVYFNCCRTLQHQQANIYRHMIFLTETAWNDIDVKTFQSSGIEVTSIVDFVRSVTGRTVEPQPVVQKLDFGIRESSLFTDLCTSSAVETIQTLIPLNEGLDGLAEETSEGNSCKEPQMESCDVTAATGSFLHNSFTCMSEAATDHYVAGTG